MPAMVGGFGKKFSLVNIFKCFKISTFFSFALLKKIVTNNYLYLRNLLNKKIYTYTISWYMSWPGYKIRNFYSSALKYNSCNNLKKNNNLGNYLAGLIEGDGTIAVHDKNSTATKYRPMIIIVFKKEDLPLANYLKNLTNCGNVQFKENRGYVLWQIGAIVEVYKIVNLVNGYFRTPKIEALNRSIEWINDYIDKNKNNNLPSTVSILSQIEKMETKNLDYSPINSNSWLSGFSDSDANFSINITKRKNGSPRIQVYYRLEIRQTYHRLDINEISFFEIMSKIALFLNSNVLSRTRISKDKKFFSFIVTAASKNSINNLTQYFNKYPLLSSKRLDYLSWCCILKLQENNPITTTYIDKALEIRKDFNKTRTTYKWDHLLNSYLE